MERPTLSVILPIYNEAQVIPELDRRLTAFLQTVDVSWEVLFLNDGSNDGSFELIRAMVEREPRYRLFSFSRNFGHQLAITAGVDLSRGDAVVVMDADLQDPPEVVAEMLARWREGYDVVFGVRKVRHAESFFKRATASIFYRLLRLMVGVDIPLDAGDFRLMSRRVVMTLRALRETSRFVRGMVAWVGFRQTAVYYERAGRYAGDTHYPLRKMLKFAVDAITSFSIVPLRIATWLGVFAGLVAILVAVWAVYVRLLNVSAVPGWATIMIAVTLAASAQLLMTGILGEYVGRIYEEVKRRPLYIIQDRIDAYAGEPSELDIRAGAALATPHPSLVPRADTRAVLDGD